MHDLRTFLETIRSERPRDIVDVYREVDPRHETAAILIKLEQRHRSPVLVFHQVRGSALPVVTNVCGSMARLALALGCSIGEVSQTYAARVKHPLKPELAASAPVQDSIALGDRINLQFLPQLIYHEHDAHQPYITGAIVVARDPETGKSNLSFHRLMVTGRDQTCIFIARRKHLDVIFRKYERAGQAMPLAAFIGIYPLWAMGALYTGSAEVEEYDIIGGLQQCPLRLTPCITQPLRVPADAELVLEGIVPPRETRVEGPFGEFTGYSNGTMEAPGFQVQAITSRREPLFQDIVSGHLEHLLLPVVPMEHYLLSIARAAIPTTTSIKIAAPLTVVAAIDKSDDSQPRELIAALLQSDIYTKHVIVVDHDVSVSDLREVATAIALHMQPDRDIYIFPAQAGSQLDPSADPADGTTAKLGIDATVSLKSVKRVKRNTVPQHILDGIDVAALLDPLGADAGAKDAHFSQR